MLNPDDFKKSLQAIDALGSTPAVLIQVINRAKDPAADVESICALLRNDGPLAADIIRISNSPYYAPPALNGNLNEAVNQIGLREVIRVVNLSVAGRLFAHDLPAYGITAFDYWNDSIAFALTMEALAKRAGLDAEDAYTIGILHALGRILIDRVIHENGFSVYWESTQPVADWERGMVGFDYAEAGAMLLEHWRFPGTTCGVIRGQISAAKVKGPVSMEDCLHFSHRLLARTGCDFEKKDGLSGEPDPFLAAAGMDADALSALVGGCREEFQEILKSVDWR